MAQQQQGSTLNSPHTYPPAPATSNSSPLAVLDPLVKTTEGLEWRRSKLSIFSLIGATLILVTWLVAAVWLYAIDLFLPLNFFGRLERPVEGEDDEGFFHWTNGTYNVLITLAGTSSWVIISYALAVGFSSLLRRQFLRQEGVSLSTYGALVKLTAQALHFEKTWFALAALVAFVVAQLYPTATQAAFGTSFAHFEVDVPYNLVRLASSLDLLRFNDSLNTFATLASVSQPNFDTFLLADAHLFGPRANASVFVGSAGGSTEEDADRGLPLFETWWLAKDTQTVATRTLPPHKRRLVQASLALSVVTNVEGFFADASCALVDVPFARAPVVNGSFQQFNLDFSCGATSAFYSTAPPNPRAIQATGPVTTLSDYYACPSSNSSTVFIFTVDVGASSSLAAYECNVSASSALVQISASTERYSNRFAPVPGTSATVFPRATISTIIDNTRFDIPPSSGLVGYLGRSAFRTRGMLGDDMLAASLEVVAQSNNSDDIRNFVEQHVETEVKKQLAQLSTLALTVAGYGVIRVPVAEHERVVC